MTIFCMSQRQYRVRPGSGFALLTLLTVLAAPCTAASWAPTKNVEIIVGTSPGGGQDISARFVQKYIQERKLVKVSTTIVNKPGASTSVGYAYLNQFPGDGNYIMLLTVPLITNYIVGLSPISYREVTPLAILWDEYIVASVAPNSTIKSGSQLLAKLRKDPSSVRIGVSAITSGGNLSMAWAAKTAGVNPKTLKVVSFKSGGEAITAMMGGHIDVVMTSTDAALKQMKAGTAQLLAIAAPQRQAGDLADIPTWREQGANVVFSNWRAIIGPRGLSPNQINYWEDTLGKLTSAEEFKREMGRNHWVGNFKKSVETRNFMQEQHEDLSALLTDLGLVKQ